MSGGPFRLALLPGAVAALLGVPAPSAAQTMRSVTIARTGDMERVLRVSLEFNGGNALIVPAAAGTLYGMRLRYDADRYQPVQQYDAGSGRLRIGVERVGGMGLRVTSRTQLQQTARFEFAPDVPLDLTADFGSSEASVDLGGMTLRTLELRTAASHATVDFSRPVTGECRSATFTIGASHVVVLHAAQSGCAVITVDGGAGGATLRFDGAWQRNIALVVDMAMGRLSLAIPRGIGVHIEGRRFLAPLDAPGFARTPSGWTSVGYAGSDHRLDVSLQASMVDVDVKWITP
ncbi:MAG: hypothetical protein ACREL5_09995 [Gemmatimonadales bacterium]